MLYGGSASRGKNKELGAKNSNKAKVIQNNESRAEQKEYKEAKRAWWINPADAIPQGYA